METIKLSKAPKDESMYKILSAIFGLSLFVIGIKDKEIFKILIGILLLFYTTYKKHIYLYEKGVVYTYEGFLFKRKEEIDFAEIDEITIVKQNNHCIVFFIREPMAKKLIITNDKLDSIVNFIRSSTNINIKFEK